MTALGVIALAVVCASCSKSRGLLVANPCDVPVSVATLPGSTPPPSNSSYWLIGVKTIAPLSGIADTIAVEPNDPTGLVRVTFPGGRNVILRIRTDNKADPIPVVIPASDCAG
jgi:hypothetical protein